MDVAEISQSQLIDDCMQNLRRIVKTLENYSRTVVGVVDRLAAKGLVIRNPDASDRRKVSLEPTQKGRELLQAAPHPAQGHLLAGLETMDRSVVENLHRGLRILVHVMEAEQLVAPFFLGEG